MTVSGWVGDDGAIGLWGDGGCHGVVHPAGASAGISVPRADAAGPAVAAELEAMCTVALSLLLGRLDHALVHAAGAVDPNGGAWLLVGDSRSGKSTTCLNLVRAGWRYLADDHVVLGRDAVGATRAEGWLKDFHIDAGWPEGASLGHRVPLDLDALRPDRWMRTAPLAGLLFPRVHPADPTVLGRLHPADALARLLRAGPWLFFDAPRAPRLLDLLQAAATLPAFDLRLGQDVYRDAERLAALLAPLTERPDTHIKSLPEES